MAAPPLSAKSPSRLADRLAAARRGRFVGREAELELFRSALLAAEPPFAVLHLYGPGGVGKTTLLREYARVAAESGRSVILLDGRNIDPSPVGFLLALRLALGQAENGRSSTSAAISTPLNPPATGGGAIPAATPTPFNPPSTSPLRQAQDAASTGSGVASGHSPATGGSRTTPDWPPEGVLLIDTYESLAPLEGWLRESFLPQLSGRSLVVIAGRNPPASAWRTDMAWAALTRFLSLRNLRPEESQTYLTVRGLPSERHAKMLGLTHGHPLALSLVADVLSQREPTAPFSLQAEPDIVRVLLERFMQDVPSPNQRLALQVCALAWATTEALLAYVIEPEEVPAIFDWLGQLSFIERGPLGLFPHDLAREVLEADFRWRNPDSYQQLNQRLAAQLQASLLQSGGAEQQRLWLDLLYLTRHNPFMKSYFDWSTLHSAYAEPASAEDAGAILAMVQAHEGEASAEIARYWLGRQPQAFKVYRNVGGELIGFMAHLSLRQITAEERAADPAVAAAASFTERYGPARAGEEILYLRFWMDREAYQALSPALNLTAINSTIDWTTHPKLAWNFIATAIPEFYQPHFAFLNIRRSPEADFEVEGRRYGVFSHDWRVEPASTWLQTKAERYPQTEFTLETLEAALPPPLLVLSQPEFEEAVRQALRDYTRPDLLAANPLMRSRLVAEAAEGPISPANLQLLLREAAASLTGNPKDEKLYRAIHHTYLEPALTQERAAELLDLPFNTYRYHLTNGLKRITEWLWQRELHHFGKDE